MSELSIEEKITFQKASIRKPKFPIQPNTNRSVSSQTKSHTPSLSHP